MIYRHGESRYRLEPGDSLFFDAMSPHGPAELLELPAIYLSIISNAADSGHEYEYSLD